MLFCVATNTYSQELAKIVNSPKALQLEAEMKSVENEKARIAYFTEITKTEESQAVLKKMQEAKKAGKERIAPRIKKDYFDLLRHAAQEKFRLRQMDLETLHKEIEAANKISDALLHLAFPPVKLIDGRRIPEDIPQ